MTLTSPITERPGVEASRSDDRASSAVLRVNGRQEGLAGKSDIAAQAEHRAAVVCRPQFVGAEVELPKADVHGGGREPHALLTFVEEVLGHAALAPLHHQGDEERRLHGEDQERRKDEFAMLIPEVRRLMKD